jgi:hypothetical protein
MDQVIGREPGEFGAKNGGFRAWIGTHRVDSAHRRRNIAETSPDSLGQVRHLRPRASPVCLLITTTYKRQMSSGGMGWKFTPRRAAPTDARSAVRRTEAAQTRVHLLTPTKISILQSYGRCCPTQALPGFGSTDWNANSGQTQTNANHPN